MSKYQNFGKLTHISGGILLMYIAFNSASNLQSQIMDTDGFGQMGFYILAVLYLFMGFGSLLSTAIINKYGSRKCMIAGGIGNVQWILMTILAAEQERKVNEDLIEDPNIYVTALLFLSTMINGLTVGILWTCANNYVARCSSIQNKGFAFSYFWTFYMTSQILGNMIAAYTLNTMSQTSFFLIMGGIALMGTLVFVCLQQPTIEEPKDQQEIENQKDEIETMDTSRTEEENKTEMNQSEFKSDIKLDYLFQQQQQRYQICLSFGEIAGAIVQGKIVDKYGSKQTCLFNVGLILLATMFVLNYMYLQDYSLFAFVMTFMWGFQDSAISVHLNSVLGFEFDESPGPFSLDSLLESTFVFAFQLIQSLVVTWSAHFLYMSAVGVLGMGMCLTSYFFEYRHSFDKKTNQNRDQIEGIALTQLQRKDSANIKLKGSQTKKIKEEEFSSN
eukprot:403337297